MSLSIGGVLGLFAGYYGGIAEALIMRLADLQMAFSTILLILVIVVMVGPGAGTLMLVFGIAYWAVFARMVRSIVLSLRELLFVQAARSIGCSHRRIIFVHIMPNVVPMLISLATVEVARLMVAEAGLSFLGYGVQPPTVSWGLMIAAGRDYLSVAWWLVTFPGLAIALTVLAVSLVGVWLRDFTSPYLRSGQEPASGHRTRVRWRISGRPT
ncbi:MAG TPA: ABC transporter permease [Candidatus Limnocylindria bacterium]|jgi:peptide/nickel transport system permease protein|nr:ABC transporter permease [Candidatus Limnocylindria bacterium]